MLIPGEEDGVKCCVNTDEPHKTRKEDNLLHHMKTVCAGWRRRRRRRVVRWRFCSDNACLSPGQRAKEGAWIKSGSFQECEREKSGSFMVPLSGKQTNTKVCYATERAKRNAVIKWRRRRRRLADKGPAHLTFPPPPRPSRTDSKCHDCSAIMASA